MKIADILLVPEMIVLLGLAAISLAGCAGGPVTLSQAAQAACKGQSAANVATEAAMALGQVEVAAAGAAVSAGLGIACKW